MPVKGTAAWACRIVGFVFFVLWLCGFDPAPATGGDKAVPPAETGLSASSLAAAVICEDVKNHEIINPGVVFPVEMGKVLCFTVFDPVALDTFIHHRWYYRDRLSTSAKLSLRPPRWATYSRMQLREADKGPWRVEITDAEGRHIRTLRFSITQ